MITRYAPLILCVFALGCGADVDGDGTDGVDPTTTGQATSTGQLHEELRLGGLEGDIEYTYTYVTRVAPAPDGSFWVADRQGPLLRRYDAAGVHLLTVERPGQGPGELASIDGLAVDPAGNLAVFDARNARISWLDEEGAFIESYPVVGAASGAVALADDGATFVHLFPESGLVESMDGIAMDWARVDRSGAIQRLAAVPLEEAESPNYVVSGRGGYYHPFTVMTVSAIGPGGDTYTARNDEYRITHRHPSGEITEIVRDEEPIRVTADEKRDWEGFSELGAARPGRDRSDFFPIPDTKPFIRELRVDLDGRLWVSRYTEAVHMEYSEWERNDRVEKGRAMYNWRDELTWDVFSPNDEYLGAVTLPFKTSLATATGNHVWGIQAGDYNEDYVVRWRFELPG